MITVGEIQKGYECLVAWREFYAKNQKWSDHEKAQKQVDEYLFMYGEIIEI